MNVMQKINPKDAYLFVFFFNGQFTAAPLHAIRNPI